MPVTKEAAWVDMTAVSHLVATKQDGLIQIPMKVN